MEVSCEFRDTSCDVSKIAIKSADTKIKSFNGLHKGGKSNQDIYHLRFYNCELDYFPRGLTDSFSNLTTLSMDNCGLKSISREDLCGLGNLECLDLSSNKITSLPTDLFTDMRRLKRIDFDSNPLKFVNSNILEPILGNGLTNVRFTRGCVFDFETTTRKEFGQSLELFLKRIDAGYFKPDEDIKTSKKEEFTNNVFSGFKDLWVTKKFSDFLIIVDSKEFPVHKNILSIQSPVFDVMLSNDMQEIQTNRMNIEDFSQSTVEAFLYFLYTGEETIDADAIELFKIAAKYNVSTLKSLYKEKILSEANESNAIDVFILGFLYDAEDLKLKALSEIRKVFPTSEFTEKFMTNPKALKDLIDMKSNYIQKVQEAEDEFNAALQQWKIENS